jgi:PAS domain S-box-containing protein
MPSQRAGEPCGNAAGAELLAAALQTVAQPVWVIDRDGLIRFVNAAAVAVLGYSGADELLGRDSHQTIHHHRPDGRPYPADECPLLRPRVTGQTVSRGLDWFFRRDGSMFRVSYVSAPLEMADGRGAVLAFTDIEARSRAEEALRDREARLAGQQAALRRIGTLVARGLGAEPVFEAVAEEAEALCGSDISAIVSFEVDGTIAVKGAHGGPPAPIRTRLELAPDYVVAAVRETGRAARFDTDDPWAPDMPEVVRALGIRSGLAAPIIVDGQLWGAITIAAVARRLPARTEQELTDFTELVATAIASAQAREDLHRLADEQAALRRVATLVAREAPQAEVFTAIAEEAGQLLGTEAIRMMRFEDDGTAVVVACWGQLEDVLPLGARHPLGDSNAASRVFSTGQAARVDDYATASGSMGEHVRSGGVRCVVATPILVESRLWGTLAAGTVRAEPLPPDTEWRLGQFTELMATAIANAEARAEVERLAHEQAALRRVATLVAQGASPGAVFAAVAAEVNALLDAEGSTLGRYEPGREITIVAHHGPKAWKVPAGTRWDHKGENVTTMVRRTERPARIEDAAGRYGALGRVVEDLGVRAAVGAPIVVEGRLWGVAVAHWSGQKAPPPDSEERMAQFAQLLETAIANADARDQLNASRARLVTEADDARRRVVRDLHDGAQQRFVQNILTLKLALRALREDGDAESLVAGALEQAELGHAELRELAHGILPGVLMRGGLRAGVDAVVKRLDLPVAVDVPAMRFTPEIEASAYFITAEALTNVVKHAHATRAEVTASVQDGALRVEVRDDGVGGADRDGHGLVGMSDRVTALGGRLEIDSPAGGGTRLTATLPLPGGA